MLTAGEVQTGVRRGEHTSDRVRRRGHAVQTGELPGVLLKLLLLLVLRLDHVHRGTSDQIASRATVQSGLLRRKHMLLLLLQRRDRVRVILRLLLLSLLLLLLLLRGNMIQVHRERVIVSRVEDGGRGRRVVRLVSIT